LVEIRDNLGALIKSFETADLKITEKKEENNKTTRRLTAAELGKNIKHIFSRFFIPLLTASVSRVLERY
jgi:hypothetical protein